jgi:hypothetical protein
MEYLDKCMIAEYQIEFRSSPGPSLDERIALNSPLDGALRMARYS